MSGKRVDNPLGGLITQAEFEKIKKKYRNEALVAIKEAERRGYEKGKEETEQRLQRRKSASEAANKTSTPISHGVKVRKVMEQAYTELKNHAAIMSTAKKSMDLKSIKNILLSTANNLIEQLEEESFKGFVNETISNSTSRTNFAFLQRGNVISVSSNHPPPDLFMKICIEDCTEKVKKTIFEYSKPATYTIASKIIAMKSDNRGSVYVESVKNNRVERTENDFKELRTCLQQQFPYYLIPLLPTVLDKDRFELWLQYVCLMNKNIQKSSALTNFLLESSIAKDLWNVDTGSSSFDYENTYKIRNQFTHNRNNNKYDSDAKLMNTQITEKIEDKDLWRYAKLFRSLNPRRYDSTYSDTQTSRNSTSSKKRYNKVIGSYRRSTAQEVNTALSDSLQLQFHSRAAVKSTATLINSFRLQSSKHALFASSLIGWNEVVDRGTTEALEIGVLSSTMNNMQDTIKVFGENQYIRKFLLHLQFYYESNLINQQIVLQNTLKRCTIVHIGNASEVERDMQDSFNSVYTEENEDSQNDLENVAKAWKYSRHIRSYLLSTNLLSLCKFMRDQHKTIKEHWQNGLEQINVLNVRYYAGNDDDIQSLRTHILHESSLFEESLSQRKGKVESSNTNSNNDSVENNSTRTGKGFMDITKLLSFRAVLSRPIINHGSRREPTKSKAVVNDDVDFPCNHNTSKTFVDSSNNKKYVASKKIRNHNMNAKRTNRLGNKITSNAALNEANVPENVFGSIAPAAAKSISTSLQNPQTKPNITVKTSSEIGQDSHKKAEKFHKTERKGSFQNVHTEFSADCDQLKQPQRQHQHHQTANVEDSLPEQWEMVHAEDGSVYYYHKVTRVSRWDRPSNKVAAALEARLNKSQDAVKEAVDRRRIEREKLKLEEEVKVQNVERLQGEVSCKINRWKVSTKTGSKKNIVEMLCTLHELINFIPSNALTFQNKESNKFEQSEVKKVYLKALKYVHPDKVREKIEIDQQMLAESSFILLNETYKQYTSK